MRLKSSIMLIAYIPYTEIADGPTCILKEIIFCVR